MFASSLDSIWIVGRERSPESVADDPAIKLDASSRPQDSHTPSKKIPAGFITHDCDHEEGESRNREVREGNHTSTERPIEPLEVAEEGDQRSL